MATTTNSPAIEKYGQLLWDEMAKEAETDSIYGEGSPVFRGRYTKCWDAIGASRAHYSKVRAYLIENGFIDFVEQGSRNRGSIIVLAARPPDPRTVSEARAENLQSEAESRLTEDAAFAKLSKEVEALRLWREGIGGINIGEAFRNMEFRLSNLESKSNK